MARGWATRAFLAANATTILYTIKPQKQAPIRTYRGIGELGGQGLLDALELGLGAAGDGPLESRHAVLLQIVLDQQLACIFVLFWRDGSIDWLVSWLVG